MTPSPRISIVGTSGSGKSTVDQAALPTRGRPVAGLATLEPGAATIGLFCYSPSMVRLESISIQRFRGIREGKVEGFADVNVFVGRNNSGKTTVAEALAWVAIHEGRDPLGRPPVVVFRSARNEEGGPITPALWFGHDQSAPILLQAVIGGARWNVTIDHNKPNLNEIPRCEGIPEPVLEFARRLTLFRAQDTTNREIESKVWAPLLATRRDKGLAQALREIFGMTLEQFQYLPDGRLMLMFPDFGVPIDSQGDGTRAALRCLMMLSALRDTLFILEEPENHQHPGSLDKFSKAVCRLARSQRIQLLIITHSAECVRAFQQAAREAGSDEAVFHLQLENGRLDARRLDDKTAEALRQSGVDVRWLDLYV